jgi:uncharacterized membrane protein
MDALVLLVVVVILALPLVAFAMALVLFRRHGVLKRELIATRDRLQWLDSRLSKLERPKTVSPQSAVEPKAAEPAPPRGITATGAEAAPVPPAAVKRPPVAAPAEPSRPATAPKVAPAVPSVPTPPATGTTAGGEIERQIGTRIAIWLGAVALALSGGFLVKYSFDQGLIGPATRVALGLAFGVGLLGVAEWMYRRSTGVAQGLAAAGIAVLYTSLLAGVRLYDLISPTVGFAGMLLTTAAAVALSLRHGPLVAVLGLLGGFLTPIFISTGEQRPWQLLFYLALLQIGLLIVSRRKRWWPISGLALTGAMGWAVLWMVDLGDVGGATLHIGLLLVFSIVSFIATIGTAARGESGQQRTLLSAMSWGGAGVGTLLLAALVGVGDFGLVEWTFLGIVSGGCIVLGRLDKSYEGLAWLASLAGAGVLLLWGLELDPGDELRLWAVAAALATLHVGGAYLALWGSARPDRWAALASLSGIVYLLAAYAGSADVVFRIPWGVQALVLGALFIGLAVPVARRRDRLAHGNLTLAALALSVTALVSLAVPIELERAWITVAWAVEIPAVAWIALRLRLPVLEKLAWVLGGLVGVRLLANPALLDYPIGDGLVLNWLLYGYGIPIVAFVAGALLFRRMARERSAELFEAGAMVLGFAYLTLSIRQYFHPGQLGDGDVMFAEWGAFTVVWLSYGLALIALYRATDRRIYGMAGAAAGMLALAQGLLVQCLAQNPLVVSIEVGQTLIFNRLLFVYGLPAVLAVFLAREFEREELKPPAWVSGSAALVFAFVTLSLEVRQAFHGGLLDRGATTHAEMYTYSLVWVLFAIALLVAGIATRGVVLRYGSAVVMAVAVGKVFLLDTAQLEDLYRVFSLFGLGVTLMLLAFLYQKFVFRESKS